MNFFLPSTFLSSEMGLCHPFTFLIDIMILQVMAHDWAPKQSKVLGSNEWVWFLWTIIILQWKKWLSSWESGGGDNCEGQAELLVQTINLSAGHWISEEQMFSPQYQRLLQLTNTLCHTLSCYQKDKVSDSATSTS